MDTALLVSIVIPVKNGAYWLEDLFQRLMQQTLFHQAEIIVIDSGSTDGSIEICGKYPVHLIQIAAEAFNHGETRNQGMRAAKGEFVVFSVQDALPENEKWLELLLQGFDDEHVAGVCGQQVVPHEPDKNPVSWFRPIDGPSSTKYVFPRREDFDALSPDEKSWYCRWDNVNAAYRRKILEKVPFRRIGFAEDGQWAKDALSSGYAIVYTSFSRVYHYHYDSPAVVYKRVFEECYARYILFGVIPGEAPFFKRVLRDMKVIIMEGQLPVWKKLAWLKYNLRIRVSANRSIAEFIKWTGKGEEQLNRRYAEICGKSQQALAPTGVR